jgi:hypothetical protein
MLNWSYIPPLKEWKNETHSRICIGFERCVGWSRRLRREDEGTEEGVSFDAVRLDRENYDDRNKEDWRSEVIAVSVKDFGGSWTMVQLPPYFLPPSPIACCCITLLHSEA